MELGEVRICRKCRRGRANLIGPDGEALSIPLDAARAARLGREAEPGDVPWLGDLVAERLVRDGTTLREVVLDVERGALRALVSCERDGEPTVLACTPQEGVDLAQRAGVPIYATDDALAQAAGATAAPGETLH
jgi:bifunctional DNase/RNase